MAIILSIITFTILLLVGMRLAERLGYPFWYGLFIGIPIVNLAVLALFAFQRSPREDRIASLEEELAALRAGPPKQLVHDT